MPDDSDEDYIIRVLTEHGPALVSGLQVGPGDDAAVLSASLSAGDGAPTTSVITADAMVEGVHWDARLSPADVGWKLVAVNASDVAAMGATPTWATLTASLPSPLDRRWVDAFARGLRQGLRRFGLALIGGDTTNSPGPRVFSLTAAGRLEHPPLLRSGARPGDDLWVSGTLGDADAGLRTGATAGSLLAALARPEPPTALGPALAARGLATAAMDLSDGLARDLPRLCAASGVGALVEPAALPASEALLALGDPLPHQAAGGEDYQLLFTTPSDLRSEVTAAGRALGTRLTRIGQITGTSPVLLRGLPWPPAWSHFQGA